MHFPEKNMKIDYRILITYNICAINLVKVYNLSLNSVFPNELYLKNIYNPSALNNYGMWS